MSQLLVRNVSADLVHALKQRAQRHGRSAEAEHRLILEQALTAETSNFRVQAAALRLASSGRIKTDSADLIREDRDQH